MYFYFFNSYTSTDTDENYPYLFVQPYIQDGVTFDENNLPKMQIKFNGTYGGVHIVRTYTNTSNIYPFLANYGQFRCNKNGYPYLVSSKTELNKIFLSPLNSKIINGKYKKNTRLELFPDRPFQIGFTIPIKYSRTYNGNTINFKYLAVSCYEGWYANGEFDYQNINICSYSNPSVNLSAPTDLSVVKLYTTTNLIFDFGNNNQEVPEPFYNWFLQNFEKIYENIYTIKSTTGETLTTLTEAPPMTSATLSAVGNAKYLTLKGENDTNYTMEWTSETPQGKIFAGLATSKGGSIVIPVGETSTINLTESTDLYEVWQTYRPPTTTFDINLYKNSAEPNKVDKTAELSTIGTISGVLRQECSLINPEIIIQYDKPPDFNYCYIANFGRYYYVENIVSMRQNLWRVRLRCDVLMTYKTQILKLTARIARQQYTYSYRQIDSEIPFTNDPEITVQDIPNSVNLGKPNYENILLTVVDNGT